jgi:hypothetical protein
MRKTQREWVVARFLGGRTKGSECMYMGKRGALLAFGLSFH